MLKRFLLCFVAIDLMVSTLAAQSPAPAAKTDEAILVAAAANVSNLGDQLKQAFLAKHPAAKLEFSFGASGNLTTQIQNGAPFHVFMSADTAFPKTLFDGGFAASKPVIYATGKVVLLSIKPMDFSKGLSLLKDSAVTQFAIANPETAPYGKAARDSLIKLGLWDTVKGKAVFAQTITQAAQFTIGATGIGFVNKSALYTKELTPYDKKGSNWFEVDTALHAPIEQAFVVLKTAQGNATALAFADFLGSKEAKSIFLAFGYAVP